jgi:hypothetical protein
MPDLLHPTKKNADPESLKRECSGSAFSAGGLMEMLFPKHSGCKMTVSGQNPAVNYL